MNKKLFLAGLFCLVSFALQAQKDDLGLWTSVGMEKRLFWDFDLSLEGEFRSRDKLSEVGRWSGSAGMAYKITNWLKAATAYTYIYYNHPLEITNKGNVISEYWQPKHRFYFQLTGKISLNRFTFSLRERWQYTYRPFIIKQMSQFTRSVRSETAFRYIVCCLQTRTKHVLSFTFHVFIVFRTTIVTIKL